MQHAGNETFIVDALVFLVAAGLIVPLLSKLKLPAIIGFILAGIALGPSGVGTFAEQFPILDYVSITNPDAAAPFAELGILCLLFILGLELSFERLWALRQIVFGAGLMQIALSSAAIACAAMLLGIPPTPAALIGLALSLSSTAMVMQLLADRHVVATAIGSTALGILLMQDIMVAPILIFTGFAAEDSSANLLEILPRALLEGVMAIAVIVFIGRVLLRRFFHLATAAGGRSFLMALTLLTVVGAAVITASAGLSIALGAFLAGILLGETEFKYQVKVDLEPFKGLLLGLFFMSVGLSLNIEAILENWIIVLSAAIGLITVKAVIIMIAVGLFTRDTPRAVETGLLMAPAGEFAFVIIGAGLAAGVLDARLATILTAITGITMLASAATWALGRNLAARAHTRTATADLPSDYKDLQGQVIIAGFGRVGQAISNILEAERTEIVALDTNPVRTAEAQRTGRKVYYGDGTHAEVLLKAGLKGASMFVITVDDANSAERMVHTAANLRPNILILARAHDTKHAEQLYEAGASYVVPDAIEAGLQISARALQAFGYEGETVRDLIASERTAAYRKA